MPKMFLDYGHGGNDPGAINGKNYEKDFNLQIGKQVKAHLERHKQTVLESRKGDESVTLNERSNKANHNNVDIVVSLHCNSSIKTSANGIEIFHHEKSKRGKELANSVLKSLVKSQVFKSNRGLKTNNFHMTRETKAPSVIVEMGFISNANDLNALQTKQEEISKAVAKGILNFYGMMWYDEEKIETVPKYFVQAGAYKKRENAEKLVKKLKEKGFDAIIKEG